MTFRHVAPVALAAAALLAGCPQPNKPADTPSAETTYKPTAKPTTAAATSAAPSPAATPSTAASTAASPATSPAASPSTTASPAASPAAAATTGKVDITGFKFVPAEITIKKGGTITFTNKDAAPHTVTPTGAAKFEKSGNMDGGATKDIKFDTVGEQPYQCDYHTGMTAKVIVVE